MTDWIKYIVLVWISVIDHEPSPLGHLTQVSVGVVEILHSSDVGLRGQIKGKLKSRLVAVQARQDSDVILLVENIVCGAIFLVPIVSRHIANDLASISIPQLLSVLVSLKMSSLQYFEGNSPNTRGRMTVRCDDQRRDAGEVLWDGRSPIIGWILKILQPHVPSS